MNTQNPTAEVYPVARNTGNTILKLFGHCKNNLSAEELSWFSGITDHAINEARNLEETLNVLASMYGHKDSEHILPTPFGLSDVLFGLADRVGTIAALVHVSTDAEYLEMSNRSGQIGD